MIKRIPKSEQIPMSIEHMEKKYTGMSILYIVHPSVEGRLESGIPVAISDFADVFGLKAVEREYLKQDYDMAITVSDYDKTTFTFG